MIFKELHILKDFSSANWKQQNRQNQYRTNAWANFIEEYFSTYYSTHERFRKAIVMASKADGLFYLQTETQLKMTFSFLRSLRRLKPYFVFEDDDSARYLMRLSMVFSLYPGMVVGGIETALKKLPTRVNRSALADLFNQLFVRYEPFEALSINLDLLNADELEMLFKVLKGENIRHCIGSEYCLSKKESYVMTQVLNREFRFKDHILCRLVICARIKKGSTISLSELLSFLGRSKVFNLNPWNYLKHIDYWRSVLKLLHNRLEDAYVHDWIDYFDEDVKESQGVFRYHKTTMDKMRERVNNWHANLNLDFYENQKLLYWKGSTKEPYTCLCEEHEYHITELCSSKSLINESKALKHCVVTYANNCEKGLMSIFSMRILDKGIMKPVITIQVQDRKVVQACGKYNREATRHELAVIKRWCSHLGFTLHI